MDSGRIDANPLRVSHSWFDDDSQLKNPLLNVLQIYLRAVVRCFRRNDE